MYPTHVAVTRALVDRVQLSGRVLEPCAGMGQMAAVLAGVDGVDEVVTNDIDGAYGTRHVGDAGDREAACYVAGGPYAWVVTNPPYRRATAILQRAMEVATVGVAFLLRLSYMEPCRDRGAWLQTYADRQVAQLVLNPRPRFRDGEMNPRTGRAYGSDQVTVAWFVWRCGWSWTRLGVVSPFGFVTGWQDG